MNNSVLTVFRAFAFRRCPFIAPVLALFLVATTAAPAQQAGLLAHDLSGFALDMTVDQVASVANRALTTLAPGHYKVSIDTVDYDFGFSSEGHLYRVRSRQHFGQFTADSAFAAALTDRLSKKFGPPQSNQLPTGPATWVFQEFYQGVKGQKLSRETESLTVQIAGGNGAFPSVEMQLTAPKIQRRDAPTPSAPRR
jgi:hypothetical protein